MQSTKKLLSRILTCLFLACFLGIFVACHQISIKTTSDKRPNILLIIADDAGWNDVGYNGSEIQTPSIDFLATKGVQLERFYTSPTCSPSRASLLTGMPSSRIGIVAPISDKSKLSLPDSITTLPQALKKKNYETALFGKWHLGLNTSSGPNTFGFDYSYGFLHGQIDQYTHKYKNGDASWYRNGAFISEEGHATDLITKETIEWLTKKRDASKNFYIQLAFSAPHSPLQEEEKWKAPYLNTIKNSSRRDYAAAMSHMDNSIGLVLETLKKLNLEENTLVVFLSDNGAMENWYPKNEYQGKLGPNPVLGSNYPLRDWKTSNYEGAIRVPAIVYWKNHLTPKKNDNYIAITDLMPTFLSLLGVEIPKEVEGINVWTTILDSNTKTTHDIYIRGHLQESLIRKPWKIIRTRHADNSPSVIELFNIENDPQEKQNLIINNPEIAAQMQIALEKQFAKDDKKVNVELK